MKRVSKVAIDYSRYELWGKRDLWSGRKLLALYSDLESAVRHGNSLVGEYKYLAIDYIELNQAGRDEKFWVRVIDSGKWVNLQGGVVAYDAEDAARQRRNAARKQLAREEEVARSQRRGVIAGKYERI